MSRFYAISPNFRPVGGIAKILDYAVHASVLGFESHFVYFSEDFRGQMLEQKPYFQQYGKGVQFTKFSDLNPTPDDIFFFSLPMHYRRIKNQFGRKAEKFLHIIQNVRHANIFFEKGFSVELLGYPITRICITQQVRDAIEPWVLNKDQCYFVPHGFDFEYFEKAPILSSTKARKVVAFNTFKNDLGNQVMSIYKELGGNAQFREIRKGVSWKNLRSAYHEANVFLGTPLVEEGLYLPAMEAMAAGNLVITSDAVGNRFYCDFGSNCVQATHGDADAYARILYHYLDAREGRGADKDADHEVFTIRKRGYDTVRQLGLEVERNGFKEIIEEL